MLDPIAGLVDRLETTLASLGALLDQLHALTPKVEQAAADAQKLQTDAKRTHNYRTFLSANTQLRDHVIQLCLQLQPALHPHL